MTFEVFDRKSPSPSQSRNRPTVRLGANGRLLNFNVAAARLLEGVDHAVMLFDEEARRLAISPAEASSPIAYRINHMPSAANMSCMEFVRHYGLAPGVKWDLTLDNGMFCASVGDRVGTGADLPDAGND